MFNMSANTVNKCIRQSAGMTFQAYLTHKRIALAKELLTEENCRISDVAARVGYDSEFSFRRAFYRTTGIKAQTWNK